jgi:hypothetical protein
LSYARELRAEDKKVIVRYDEDLQNAAKETLRLYPAILAELTEDLGWASDPRPEIVLMKDSVSFRKISKSDLLTAFAVPGRDLIVIDYQKIGGRPFTFRATLKHELCHLVLHRHIAEDKLPRWFDEGICQWVTGGLGEIMNEGTGSVLPGAVLSNRLISIERLTAGFPSGDRDLLLAYEESKSLIVYMEEKSAASGVRGILERMSLGDSLEDAVRKNLLVSMDELEKQWRSSLSRQDMWLSYVRDDLYEILFLFASLITVFGYLKVIKKKREYKDEVDTDEREI